MATEAEMRRLGAALVQRLGPGDVVLLEGNLGAGKTALVRGLLHELGVEGEVRSPTFNLLQSFDTSPPVLHVDLYRVASSAGLGIEDYLDTHLVMIEWPGRAAGLVAPEQAWRIDIAFSGEGRRVTVREPGEL